mgnify:CR=1 FL=1
MSKQSKEEKGSRKSGSKSVISSTEVGPGPLPGWGSRITTVVSKIRVWAISGLALQRRRLLIWLIVIWSGLSGTALSMGMPMFASTVDSHPPPDSPSSPSRNRWSSWRTSHDRNLEWGLKMTNGKCISLQIEQNAVFGYSVWMPWAML